MFSAIHSTHGAQIWTSVSKFGLFTNTAQNHVRHVGCARISFDVAPLSVMAARLPQTNAARQRVPVMAILVRMRNSLVKISGAPVQMAWKKSTPMVVLAVLGCGECKQKGKNVNTVTYMLQNVQRRCKYEKVNMSYDTMVRFFRVFKPFWRRCSRYDSYSSTQTFGEHFSVFVSFWRRNKTGLCGMVVDFWWIIL